MDNISIGKRISTLRKRAGLTQKDLGVQIEKTESSVQKYEKGSTEVPLSVLLRIADALDCELYDILDFEYVKYLNLSDNATERLLNAMGYAVKFEDHKIIKNSFAYEFSESDLLRLYDDIKILVQEFVESELKKRRENRQRIDSAATYF